MSEKSEPTENSPSLSSSLSTFDPDKMVIVANDYDLRRDLHTYVNYVKGRSIKRSYRGNDLPVADYKRLAQLMAIREPDAETLEVYPHRYTVEAASWVDYVDLLAHRMGFVSYDRKGSYRGYSSVEPSFPDNFITLNFEAYNAFLELPMAEQERRLFDTLVNDYEYSYNEFYSRGILARLDQFSTWGSGIGVMPTLNFAKIRRFLFDLLQGCQPGTWYSTASLVAYLKANHRFFLIPQNLNPDKEESKNPYTNIGKRQALILKTPNIPKIQTPRYGNFHEDESLRDAVSDDAPDGFERVEGRYIERFLEGIPLTLGYVEVAYVSPMPVSKGLSIGYLKAFRVTERFLQAIRGEIPQPRVVIQPNFEIFVDSAFYPAYVINRLMPLTDVVWRDTTTILSLNKQKVVAHLVANDTLNVVQLLQNLSGRPLPQNVLVELEEWAGHTDVFTLYDGFGLVEGTDKDTDLDRFTFQQIGESLRLVKAPNKILATLSSAGAVVIAVHHTDQKLESLPEKAQTVFPRKIAPVPIPKKKLKQAVTVKREMLIVLYLPDEALFEKFRKGLVDLRCIFEANKEKRTITITATQETQLKQVIKSLSGEYTIRLEDLV